MKKLLLIFTISLTSIAFAQNNSAVLEDAVKLMKLSNSTVEASMAPFVNQIPKDNQAAFQKDLQPLLDSMYKKLANVAVEQYSHEDIKAMLKFYETDLGKTMLSGQVKLLQASMQIGQEFSMQMMPLMQKHMKID